MRVCSFHWILLKIQFDKSNVEIVDSLDNPEVLFSDIKAMLQK
jgi:Ulp1 family protease